MVRGEGRQRGDGLQSQEWRGHPRLSSAAQLVRRHDPDRFFTALFAPADRRERLMLLYALNHELARAREVASQPLIALMRLQWWREVVEGAERRHELASPLSAALQSGEIAREDVLAMIAGREVEADPEIPDLAAFQTYILSTAGAVAVAAGRSLGGTEGELGRLRYLGAAYGVAGQIRNVAALARQGRCMLPSDLLADAKLTADQLTAPPGDPRLRAVLRPIQAWGRTLLQAGGPLSRGVVSAALPGVLARRDLRQRDIPTTSRGLGDRVAIILAAWRSRI